MEDVLCFSPECERSLSDPVAFLLNFTYNNDKLKCGNSLILQIFTENDGSARRSKDAERVICSYHSTHPLFGVIISLADFKLENLFELF